MKRTVIMFSRVLDPMANGLAASGLNVIRAFRAQDVMNLASAMHVDAIVAGSDIPDDEAIEVEKHHITLRLKPEATATDVFWELSALLGDIRTQ